MERELDATLWRLVGGEIGLHELTPALAGWYTVGHDAGVQSMLPELAHANAEADRYYAAAFCPRPVVPTVTFAELQRIRGDHEGAERAEARLRELFGRLP